MNVGDAVLSPDGTGRYLVGEVIGGYSYVPEGPLPHRRSVRWLASPIARADMSEDLKRSTGSVGTVANITPHHDEIERLLAGMAPPTVVSTDESVEDAGAFVMESHLEEFLVQNWKHTVLGKSFDIYEENGEQVGRQYMTDTGPVDVLAISKDRKRLLVVELKKGRASDAVVGQTLRYMGYVQAVLAEPGQAVHGAIVALDDDQRIRRALSVTPNVVFYRYKITFELVKST